MDRIPEPVDVMNDPQQAQIYGESGLDEPFRFFVALFRQAFPAEAVAGHYLDLGCGTGEVTRPFAEAFPECTLDAVDAADHALAQARQRCPAALAARVRFVSAYVGRDPLPRERYDGIIAHSFLHHLSDPQVLWQTVRRHATPGAPVFVMDLIRPPSRDAAKHLALRFCRGLPRQILKDMFQSLLAAFRPEEVETQLAAAGLTGFAVRRVNEIQLTVHGRVHDDAAL